MTTLQYLTTTHFDFGAVKKLPKALASLNITKPLLCTDAGLIAAGVVDVVRENLRDVPLVIFDETPPNPTENAVLQALQAYKDEQCDGVLALGGGSSMDLGKAVGILAANGGPLADYALGHDNPKPIKSMVPLVAVPTTSGTGSEVSVGAVITTNDGHKRTFVNPILIPKIAVCDPNLTLGLPPLLTAATGMDAVTHCIEAFLSPVVNPPAEGIALDGLRRAVRNGALKNAVADPNDKTARWNMMMASTEGALSFIKGLGVVHSMSHSCGRHRKLKLHHGTLNAVILPAVLRFNSDHVGDKYSLLREAMGLKSNADLADTISSLNADIKLPPNLKSMGVTSDLPGLIEHSVSDISGLTNPRQASADDYVNLFQDALGLTPSAHNPSPPTPLPTPTPTLALVATPPPSPAPPQQSLALATNN